MSFIGQRADKVLVHGVEQTDDGAFVKDIEYTTRTCPDEGCEGEGYYDKLGEIICDTCGTVISGEKKPTLRMEYGDDDGTVGQSRGLEVMHERSRGSHEPSV